MSAAIPPFRPGESGLAANAVTYDKLLGNTYTINGVVYRVIKTSAALSSVTNAALVDSGTTSFNFTAAAVTSAATHRFLGILPSTQVNLASGDYALAAIQGLTTGLAGATVTAGNGLVTAASGRLTDTSGTYAATAIPQCVATALSTAAAGSAIQIQLFGR